MVSKVLWKKLLRDLWARKAALAALIVIIAIGVGGFVSMAAVYRDLDGSRERYYRECRLGDFTVDLKRAPRWAVDRIADLPNVREVRGRVSAPALIDLPAGSASDLAFSGATGLLSGDPSERASGLFRERRSEPVTGTAISMPPRPDASVINGLLLRSGAWFSDGRAREAILNEAFARENGLVPGDRVRVTLLDKQHDLLVVGTAMSPEFVYVIPPAGGLAPDPARYGILYVPEKFLQESCDLEGAYNQLVGLLHDSSPTEAANTLRLIEDRLDAFGVTDSVPGREQPSVKFLADELVGLRVSATVVPAIFLGVAALVLNIVMGRLVAQQRTVIGTLRALGWARGAVTRHYLEFGAMVGVAGGVLGIALGQWWESLMAALYRKFYALPEIEAHFYPDILLTGLLVSVVFSVLGTVRGARFAARLEPAVAMRPPPPERGGKVLPEYLPGFWNALPFRWKMILRAVFRNPFRSGVSILASLVSTALVVMSLSMVDSLDYLMRFQFEKISHEDISVSIRDPQGRKAESEIGALSGVADVEPQLVVACDFVNGPRKKRTAITGLVRHNRLNTPLDALGRPIVIPDDGLVLTRKLAEILRVAVGDSVRLRPLIARRQEVVAPVAAIVETFLGLGAYAEIGYLGRLLGEEEPANVILASRSPGADRAALFEEFKKRPTVVGIGERARSLTQLDETFGKTMGAMIWVMVFLSGLIAFGSVFNAALVSLSERQREVGTLRVLGYSTREVAGVFSGESLLLNGFGIGVGLLAGIGLTHLVLIPYDTEMYRFPAIIYPSRLLQSAAVMAGFIVVAQVIILWMIRRLDWLEALKVRE